MLGVGAVWVKGILSYFSGVFRGERLFLWFAVGGKRHGVGWDQFCWGEEVVGLRLAPEGGHGRVLSLPVGYPQGVMTFPHFPRVFSHCVSTLSLFFLFAPHLFAFSHDDAYRCVRLEGDVDRGA